MICGTCGTENLAGAKFCMECAAPLAAGCPNCGFSNLPNAKFCSECATPLNAAAARRPTAEPVAATVTSRAADSGSQRRVVSVLFADLVGFTPFAEEKDSEEVRDTLTRYFDVAREVIDRYGGTIEKFIGDAVMAVWGAPTAHEDDAERAVRAALELVDAVTGLGPGIQARAGVLTGEAAVTVGATNQGMVAGDIVNTASRLQSAAPPGAVLVGEATHRAAAAAIVFEEAGEQVLKGKQAPVAAWRAVRVVAERGGRNRTEALEAPFVGRHEEMRLLKELFHSTGREQRLRVVSVIGPGGIGKSRLAREFSLYIDGLVEDIFWHTGRCPAYGEGITFWALGEMVRERCGLAELDDEQTTRAKVAQAVGEWIDEPDDRPWIESALLALLGVESSAAPDQLFGAWRTFFERIAKKGTTCLIFEDMHFADTGLLDFVDHLLEWSRGLPIYVVTLARPELIERRQDWGAGKRNFHSIYLEPLPDDQMREVLAGLVPGLPEKAIQTIVARADGIPLYAVETVRTLVADGRLIQQDGVYVPQGDLTALSVPETLNALIAARLDTLDETDRRLLHDAAVIGQSFSLGALSSVAELTEAEIEPRMAGLVRRELLRRQMDPRSPERGQYEFVQALIREVAYNTLSRKDRKKLHLAAARHFESLGNEEIAGALASHYLAAHSNSAEGAEADALASQARIALKAAAVRASALGSYDQAARFLDQAVTVTHDAAEQTDILIRAADAARTAGNYDQAEERLRRAATIGREAGNRVAVARTSAELGRLLNMMLRPSDSVALVKAALEEFADVGEDLVAELKLNLGAGYLNVGDPRSALPFLDDALENFEHHARVPLVIRALTIRAGALGTLGRHRERLGLLTVASRLAAEQGLSDVQSRATGNLAIAVSEVDLAAATSLLREALAISRRTGQRDLVLSQTMNLGYCGFLAGVWDEALAAMTEVMTDSLGAANRIGLLNNIAIIRAARGENIDDSLVEMERLGRGMSGAWHLFVADPAANAALAGGDFVAARDAFLEVADEDPGQEPEYLYRAARPAIWNRDRDLAQELLERLDVSGGHGPLVAARRAAIAGGIASLDGRRADALASYDEAMKGFHATGAAWDEALTGLDMALLLDPTEPAVSAAAESSRAILARLGATPYLERLEQVMERPRAASESSPRHARTAAVAAEVTEE